MDYSLRMSNEYKTSMWQKVYAQVMHEDASHRRPPADRLFCRGDHTEASHSMLGRPDMAAGERAHFAKHFARDFAAALSEARLSVGRLSPLKV